MIWMVLPLARIGWKWMLTNQADWKNEFSQCYIDGVLQQSFSYRYPYQKLSFRERNSWEAAISPVVLWSYVDSKSLEKDVKYYLFGAMSLAVDVLTVSKYVKNKIEKEICVNIKNLECMSIIPVLSIQRGSTNVEDHILGLNCIRQ